MHRYFKTLIAGTLAALFSLSAQAQQFSHRANPGQPGGSLSTLSVSATAATTTPNTRVCVSTSGASTVFVTTSGSAVGAVVQFALTADLLNFYAVPLYQYNQLTGALSAPGSAFAYTASASYEGATQGSPYICTYLSAITSGAVSFQMDADPAPFSAAGASGASAAPAQLANGQSSVLSISGAQYAAVRFQFSGTVSSQTFEFDYTIDGVNWIPSGQGAPYVKRVDAVSANPTIVFGSTATVGGIAKSFNINTYGASTWEMALAANVQAVRVLALSTGAPLNQVTISSGMLVGSPGSTSATLFDETSATNTQLSLVNLDFSGWVATLISATVPSGGTGAVQYLDDTGTAAVNSLSFASGTSSYVTGGVNSFPSSASMSGIAYSAMPGLPKRVSVFIVATTALTSRLRIEVRR